MFSINLLLTVDLKNIAVLLLEQTQIQNVWCINHSHQLSLLMRKS